MPEARTFGCREQPKSEQGRLERVRIQAASSDPTNSGGMNTRINWRENQQVARMAPKPMRVAQHTEAELEFACGVRRVVSQAGLRQVASDV